MAGSIGTAYRETVAMGRARDLDGLRYRYQIIGDEDGRGLLAEFIGMVF